MSVSVEEMEATAQDVLGRLQSRQLFQSGWDTAAFIVFLTFIGEYGLGFGPFLWTSTLYSPFPPGTVLLLMLLVIVHCCCCCCCGASPRSPRKVSPASCCHSRLVLHGGWGWQRNRAGCGLGRAWCWWNPNTNPTGSSLAGETQGSGQLGPGTLTLLSPVSPFLPVPLGTLTMPCLLRA